VTHDHASPGACLRRRHSPSSPQPDVIVGAGRVPDAVILCSGPTARKHYLNHLSRSTPARERVATRARTCKPRDARPDRCERWGPDLALSRRRQPMMHVDCV
jgi:hypothetical protein